MDLRLADWLNINFYTLCCHFLVNQFASCARGLIGGVPRAGRHLGASVSSELEVEHPVAVAAAAAAAAATIPAMLG